MLSTIMDAKCNQKSQIVEAQWLFLLWMVMPTIPKVDNILKLKIDPNLVVFGFLMQISMLNLWVMAATFVNSGNDHHPTSNIIQQQYWFDPDLGYSLGLTMKLHAAVCGGVTRWTFLSLNITEALWSIFCSKGPYKLILFDSFQQNKIINLQKWCKIKFKKI